MESIDAEHDAAAAAAAATPKGAAGDAERGVCAVLDSVLDEFVLPIATSEHAKAIYKMKATATKNAAIEKAVSAKKLGAEEVAAANEVEPVVSAVLDSVFDEVELSITAWEYTKAIYKA